MTVLQQHVIEAYKRFLAEDTIPTLGQMAERVYGKNTQNNKVKVRQVLTLLERDNIWPWDNHVVMLTPGKRGPRNGHHGGKDEDTEITALVEMTRLIGTLDSKGMTRIIDAVKKGAYTKNEMFVLMKISEVLEPLEKGSKERLFKYMDDRFHI